MLQQNFGHFQTWSNTVQHVTTCCYRVAKCEQHKAFFHCFHPYFIPQEIVAMLSLKPGQKVLDVGCGIGGSGFYMVKVWLDPFFSVIGGESWLYQSTEHRAKPKLSCHLPNCTVCNLFLGLLSSFFLWIESEISEQVRWQVATEEPNKGFWICQVPYVMLSCYVATKFCVTLDCTVSYLEF